MQPDQLGPRIDADLVAQDRPGGVERPQRVDRPSGPVERQRQLGPSPLAERLGGHRVGQRGDEPRGLPGGQPDVGGQLVELRRPLVEAHGRRRTALVAEGAERAARPQRRRRRRRHRPLGEPAVAREGRGVLDEPLEAVDVDVVGVGVDDVPAVAPPDRRRRRPAPARRFDT